MERVETTAEEYLARIEKTLLGIKRVLTLEEACIYTGISRGYMYRLTSNNTIPYSKGKKFIYFDRSRLDQWLIENPRKTKKEIEEEALSYLVKNKKA